MVKLVTKKLNEQKEADFGAIFQEKIARKVLWISPKEAIQVYLTIYFHLYVTQLKHFNVVT